jgi:hypothetical protein
MVTVSNLVEEWIQIRTTLTHQVKQIESGKSHAGDMSTGVQTEVTLTHLKSLINELNLLLKEYAGAH